MTRAAKKNTTRKDTANPPVAKIRVGLITANVWERAGKNGTFYAVTFERRYRDSEGTWQTAHSFDTHDLLGLAKAADLAHTEILALQADS